MAQRRNPGADLRLASACALPFGGQAFDRVFPIDSVQFWESLPLGLCEVLRVLKPNGLAAIAIQPRNKGATAQTTAEWGDQLEAAFKAVRFTGVRLAFSNERPVPTRRSGAKAPDPSPGTTRKPAPGSKW
jgi:ubiquinone/menaquinone biosynthesis C-methylase UbiE